MKVSKKHFIKALEKLTKFEDAGYCGVELNVVGKMYDFSFSLSELNCYTICFTNNHFIYMMDNYIYKIAYNDVEKLLVSHYGEKWHGWQVEEIENEF